MRRIGKRREFSAKLVTSGPGGAWTFLPIPFSVVEEFGSKARVAVAGTMNGFAFRNSVMPEGNGNHRMMVGKELQAGAKVKAGDTVKVSMQPDEAERIVEVPDELQRALKRDKAAQAAFDALAPSHRKEYAEWIGTAKKPETRAARLVKAMDMLKTGVKRLR